MQDTLKLIYEDDSTTYLDEAAILIESLGTSRKLTDNPETETETKGWFSEPVLGFRFGGR